MAYANNNNYRAIFFETETARMTNANNDGQAQDMPYHLRATCTKLRE
jgi:hypothetical protein